jgi:voltage-gated potassium channel
MTPIAREATLLTGLVVLLVARSLLTNSGFVLRGIFEVVFVVSFLGVAQLIFARRPTHQWAVGLVFVLFGMSLAPYVLPERFHLALAVGFHVGMVGFAGLAVVVILRDVFEKPQIGGAHILAVVSGYLLVGIAWGSLYAATHLLAPDSFDIHPDIVWQLDQAPLRRALFDHFSFTTLTTVGYGYVTSKTPFADTLTWLEVVCGQFYLAVVVAQLVGMKLAQAMRPGGPESP